MDSDDTLLRTLLIVIAVILLIPFLMMVFMMPMVGVWGGGHMWNSGMWDGTGATWMWFLMWLVPLAVLLGIGYLLYRVVHRSTDQETDPALEQLRLSYAQGKLSDEEYEERLNRLDRD
ncbi:SHOCT domain-containing protein [Natronocalculus amylovorans]